MATTKKMPVFLRIRNLHEHNPYTHLQVTPIRHKAFLQEEYFTYECFLVKIVAHLFPTKVDPVSINKAIIADNRTQKEISYATFGVRFGNVFGSSSSPYGSVNFDIDFIFILTDGRIIETNTKDKNDIAKILPLLQQQVRGDKLAQARRDAEVFAKASLEAEEAQRDLEEAQNNLRVIQQQKRELEERIKREAKEREEQKKTLPQNPPETQLQQQNISPPQEVNPPVIETLNDPWQTIVSALQLSSCDIRTVNKDGSDGSKWFHASVLNNSIYISKARQNTPSTTTNATLNQFEFESIFPLYWQWRDGSKSRKWITTKTQISSYIFALIFKYVDNVVVTDCVEKQAVVSKGRYDRDNFYGSDSRAKKMLQQYETTNQSTPNDIVNPVPIESQPQTQSQPQSKRRISFFDNFNLRKRNDSNVVDSHPTYNALSFESNQKNKRIPDNELYAKPIKTIKPSNNAEPPDVEVDYQLNDIVEHNTFGRGCVESIELNKFREKTINVLFDDVGLKKLNSKSASQYMIVVGSSTVGNENLDSALDDNQIKTDIVDDGDTNKCDYCMSYIQEKCIVRQKVICEDFRFAGNTSGLDKAGYNY